MNTWSVYILVRFFLFQNFFEKARIYFERSKDFDFQSVYMLSCMLFDGQGGRPDEVGFSSPEWIYNNNLILIVTHHLIG